ncbi:lactate/malate family dehydrogenase, partial [uncultured Bifidobacterium sp.]
MGTVTKIGIVGMGHVGAHVANSLVLQGIGDELYMTEQCSGDEDHSAKLAAEVQDLGDSLAFCPHNVALVNCGDDYARLAECDVIVNAAGKVSLASKDRDGELFYTTETAKTFIKPIADAGFDGVWITISNPCDVVATEIWKLSGMDPNRIIGTGTALDSSRLKYALSRATGYDQHSICAYMLGEHGSSMFAAWSAVNFGGKPLAQLRQEQPERFGFDEAQVEQEARHGGYVTYAGKQCTEFAVADAAVRLVRAVVSNEHYITPCSTLMTGDYGE